MLRWWTRSGGRHRFQQTLFGLMICVIGAGIPSDSAWAFQAEEAPAEQPAAVEPPADTGAEPAQESESFLSWMFRALGLFWGPVLLLLSFIMVALVMMNILQVRGDNLLPPDFIEAFEQKIEEKDYNAAYQAAREDDSFVARVLAAGLSRLNRGYNEAIEGMQEVGEEENMAMEHRLSYLALVGTVAPMIGLMGTVAGMIASFQTIASSMTQPKPAELADGISTALFTTLGGLIIAVPAMIFYSILRNRAARYTLEVGRVSESLMSRFSNVGKPQRSAGGSATATTPAAPE